MVSNLFEVAESPTITQHYKKPKHVSAPGGSPTIPPLRHAHRPAPPWLSTPLAAGAPFGGTSVKIGTIQRRLAWPLRKDDTHKSRMYHFCFCVLPAPGRSPRVRSAGGRARSCSVMVITKDSESFDPGSSPGRT